MEQKGIISVIKIWTILKDKMNLNDIWYQTSYDITHYRQVCLRAHVCEPLGGDVAHPSSYKRPLSLREIRSRLWNPANSHYGIPLAAHPTCFPRRLPHTSHLHCVILSAFTQTEDRSQRRLTAASLIRVNKTGEWGDISQRNYTTAQPCDTSNSQNNIVSPPMSN